MPSNKTFKTPHSPWYEFPFHLAKSANTKHLLMKTRRVFNKLSKCALSYKLGVFIDLSLIHNKTKNIQHNIFETFIHKNLIQNSTSFTNFYNSKKFKIIILVLVSSTAKNSP